MESDSFLIKDVGTKEQHALFWMLPKENYSFWFLIFTFIFNALRGIQIT